MKHLYIMRHAEAEDLETGGDDAERPLTKRGRKAARAMGRWITGQGISPEVIATSPLKRAMQTARAVRKAMAGPKPMLIPELAGECPAKDLAVSLMPVFEGAETVLVVGHQPQLAQLVSLLVTGGIYGRFDLKKGSLCRIEMETLLPAKCGSLDLVVTPESIR
ncbi:phosphohistidine phosphatase SixA [Candidatus Fermentibacteria bacterium]|nr:phosphohistidine phosphatase SixA [Candidatus Fermentibacteria bacterium]